MSNQDDISGFIQASSSKIGNFSRNSIDSHTVFKDYIFMKNSDFHYKIQFLKFYTETMEKVSLEHTVKPVLKKTKYWFSRQIMGNL